MSAQLNHMNALILGKLFGSWVSRRSLIQAAFFAPPSPASAEAVSASIIGLSGATESTAW